MNYLLIFTTLMLMGSSKQIAHGDLLTGILSGAQDIHSTVHDVANTFLGGLTHGLNFNIQGHAQVGHGNRQPQRPPNMPDETVVVVVEEHDGQRKPNQGGYGNRNPGGYETQNYGGYGNQNHGGYGNRQPGGYGNHNHGGYGHQHPGGYGNPNHGGYGNQNHGGYGNQNQGGYGNPNHGGYGNQNPGSHQNYNPGGYGNGNQQGGHDKPNPGSYGHHHGQGHYNHGYGHHHHSYDDNNESENNDNNQQQGQGNQNLPGGNNDQKIPMEHQNQNIPDNQNQGGQGYQLGGNGNQNQNGQGNQNIPIVNNGANNNEIPYKNPDVATTEMVPPPTIPQPTQQPDNDKPSKGGDNFTKNPGDKPLFVPLNPNEYTYGGDKIEINAPKRETDNKPAEKDDDNFDIDIRLRE